MGKLTESLKRAMEGLAHQDAAEYLTTSQKLEVLGIEPLPRKVVPSSVLRRHTGPGGTGRRIALISGGGSETAALDFALHACLRHAAELDLVNLRPVPTGEDGLQELSRAAKRTGLHVCQVNLPQSGTGALSDYVCSHPSLIYLVATVADDLARELAERILQTAGVQVPLVLVGGHTPLQSSSVYAA